MRDTVNPGWVDLVKVGCVQDSGVCSTDRANQTSGNDEADEQRSASIHSRWHFYLEQYTRVAVQQAAQKVSRLCKSY